MNWLVRLEDTGKVSLEGRPQFFPRTIFSRGIHMFLNKSICIFCCSLLCLCTNGLSTEPHAKYPEIEFKYDWRGYIMDFFGRWYFDAPITEHLKNQLTNQLPELITAWEINAPILFGEVFATFNRGIEAETRIGVINLSHGSSYGSHRFLIFGLRWLLDSEWPYSVSREDAFSALVFHELLHVWVDENVNKDLSSMLAKYSNEEFDVLDHLHLMAIQKMVYTKINRPDVLEYIGESYASYQGPLYRRAWEIVNDIEGHEALLQDIVIK